MHWTLDQLRQFVMAADLGSFSATARQLGKAQSAVSSAIVLLEVDFGVELFDRSRRNAQLTDDGQVLLLEARELLRQADALDLRAKSLHQGHEASLALALDEALPYAAVSALTREIATHFPNLDLTLLNGTATEVTGYVAQGRAQIAFHFVRGALPASFDQLHITAVPQGIFVVEGHALADFKIVQRKDLAQFRQLIMESEDAQETAYSTRLWRSDSYYSIAEMVADDLGWAILPVNIGTYQDYGKPLKQLHCPSLTLAPLPVRMFWRQGWQPTPRMHWVQTRFTELLRNVNDCSDMPE